MREVWTSQASLLSLFAEVRRLCCHGDQVVELSVHEKGEVEEDDEDLVEVEREEK